MTEPAARRPSKPPGGASRRLVWVSVETGNAVVEVDLDRRKVLQRHFLAGGPHNITVAPDGTVAVALPKAGGIGLIRNGRLRTVRLGGVPHDVKAAGRLLVVANEGAARVDLLSRTGARRGAVALRANPHDLAVSPDGGSVWASLDDADELAVIDLDAQRVVRYVPTGRRPHDLLFAPDGRLWVTDWNGSLHVFSRRGALLKTLGLGREAHHLAFAPREAWITDHAAERAFIVDQDDLKLREALAISGAPHHVAITPDAGLAAVVDHHAGSVVIFDVASRKRIGAVEVGEGPHGVWAVPSSAAGS